MTKPKSAFVAVAALSLLMAACKINKDANCLNPKAGCYNKDTEQPSITATNPPSAALGGTTADNPTLTHVLITFSEPMLNADRIANYPKPGGTGGANLNIAAITKTDERNYDLILSGTVSSGAIDFDLRALTDLSGNFLSNPQFTITGSSVNLSSTHVSNQPGAYGTVTATWKNTNSVLVDYQIKKGGTSCTSGATNVVTGSNLSGTNAGIYNSGTGTPTFASVINQSEVTTDPTVFRVCMTNVGAGLSTEVFFSVYRDDTPPTINTLTAGIVARPYTITLTCTDNMDKIAYRTDTTVPTFTGSTPDLPALTYSVASGFSLPMGTTQFRYICIDKAGNKSSASAAYTFNSAVVWDQSNWSAAGPTPPYDVWK